MHQLGLNLLPYVCVFESCDTASFLYEEKDEWLSHLQTVHDFESTSPESQDCPLCLQTFTSAYDIASHTARHLEGLAISSIPPHKLVDKEYIRGSSARGAISRTMKSALLNPRDPTAMTRILQS